MKWSKYNYQWKAEEDTIFIYNSRSNSLVIDPMTEIDNMDESEKKLLVKEGFLIEDDMNEESFLSEDMIQSNLDTSQMSIWIFVSNDCNLACTYCWEKGGLLHKNTNMNSDVVQKTIDWILAICKKENVKELAITYMGGEPCLNMNAIEKISNCLNEKVDHIHYNIITNGILMNESMIERMKKIHLHSYQITLDGTQSIHDKRRVYADGRGTYQTILNNIVRISDCDTDSEIVIRMNVDKENMDDLPILLRILNWMKIQKYAAICLGDTILEDGIADPIVLRNMIQILKTAKKYGFQIAFGELNHCWMPSKAWYMINQDGLLYKCPSVVGQKEYAVGNVIDNEIYPEMERELSMKPWKECLNCELVGLCRGGCPNRDRLAAKKCSKVCRKSFMKELIQLKYTSD